MRLSLANKMFDSFELTRDLEPSNPLKSHEIAYDNLGLRIRLRYPDNWLTEHRSDNDGGSLDEIVILSPSENDEYLFDDRMTIEARLKILQVDGARALDNYIHKYIEESQKSQKFTPIESVPLTVAKLTAKRITYGIIDSRGKERYLHCKL